jgi:gamma-glutamyltranspeptidase/glutathione hydrolase
VFLGDPDFVDVPFEVLKNPAYAAGLRAGIHPAKATPSAMLPGVTALERPDTTHFSIVDAEGNIASVTQTVNLPYGNAMVIPGTGFLLNNEMDDFSVKAGVPNAFGLVGSAANAVAPGARPLSSMSPTVLIGPEGQRIAVGASGGPFIISSTLQAILNVIDFQMSPSRAVAEPRIHHQWQPDVLMLDEGISADTAALLRARGHATKELPFFSAVQLIATDGPELIGGADPRKGGWPAGAW